MKSTFVLLLIALQFLWYVFSPLRQLLLFRLDESLLSASLELPRLAPTWASSSVSSISSLSQRNSSSLPDITWKLFAKSSTVQLFWGDEAVATLEFLKSSKKGKMPSIPANSSTAPSSATAINRAIATLLNVPSHLKFEVRWDKSALGNRVLESYRRMGFYIATDKPYVPAIVRGDPDDQRDYVRGLKYQSTYLNMDQEVARLNRLYRLMSSPENANRFWKERESTYGAPLVTSRLLQLIQGLPVDQVSMMRSLQGYAMLLGIKYKVPRAWDAEIDTLSTIMGARDRISWLLANDSYANAIIWDFLTGCGLEVGELSLKVQGGRRLGDSFDKEAFLLPSAVTDPFCNNEAWAGPEVVLSAVGYDAEYCNRDFNGVQICDNAAELTEFARNDWSYIGGVAEGSYTDVFGGRRQFVFLVDVPSQLLQYEQSTSQGKEQQPATKETVEVQDAYTEMLERMWNRSDGYFAEGSIIDPGCSAVFQGIAQERQTSLLHVALDSKVAYYVDSGCTRYVSGGLTQNTSPGRYHINKHGGCGFTQVMKKWRSPDEKFLSTWLPETYYEVYVLNRTNASHNQIFTDWEMGKGYVSAGALESYLGLEAWWNSTCMLGVRFKGLGLTRIYKAALIGDTSIGILSKTQKSWVLGGRTEPDKVRLNTNLLRGKYNTVLYFSIVLSFTVWVRMLVCYMERLHLLRHVMKEFKASQPGRIPVDKRLLMALDVGYDVLAAGGTTAQVVYGLPSLLTVASNLRSFSAILGLNAEVEWDLLTGTTESPAWICLITLLAMWGVIESLHAGRIRAVSEVLFLDRYKNSIRRLLTATVGVLSATGTVTVMLNGPVGSTLDLDLFAVIFSLLLDGLLLSSVGNSTSDLGVALRNALPSGSVQRMVEYRQIQPAMYGSDMVDGQGGIHYSYLMGMTGLELSSRDLRIQRWQIWDMDQKEVEDARERQQQERRKDDQGSTVGEGEGKLQTGRQQSPSLAGSVNCSSLPTSNGASNEADDQRASPVVKPAFSAPKPGYFY